MSFPNNPYQAPHALATSTSHSMNITTWKGSIQHKCRRNRNDQDLNSRQCIHVIVKGDLDEKAVPAGACACM